MKLLAAALRCLLLMGFILLAKARGTPTAAINSRTKSDEILKYMNTSVAPCDDFYQFTCGNYANYNPASEDSRTTGFFETSEADYERKIIALLNTEDPADTIIDKKVKSFFKSCQLLPTMNKEKQLRQLIAEFGQMPVWDDKWPEHEFDWMATVAKIANRYEINIFMTIEVGNDLANNQVNALYASEQDSEFPRSIYVDEQHKETLEKLRSMYAGYLQEILGLENALAQKTATEFIDFEKSLAQGRYDSQAKLSVSELLTKSSIEQAYQRYVEDFDLKQLLNIALGSIPELEIYIDRTYVENMLRVVRQTPKRTLANYIFFKLMTSFVQIPRAEQSLEDFCLADMRKHFYKNLAQMFYHKYVTQEASEAISHMWLDIKAAFHKVLLSDRLSWISEATRQYAVEKLNAVKLKIMSYADMNFTQELGPLNLRADNYVGNLRAIVSARAAQHHAIDYTVPQPLPETVKMSTRAQYNVAENVIKIPVSLLQPSFAWSPSFPNAYNFAVLGFLLSHELIHGYDGDGRSFDAQGSTARNWWQEISENGFDARTKCFIDQYHQYYFGDHQLSAMPNQDENIADNGAVRLAYNAYLNWHENSNGPVAESFTSLNYNHKQLFFISYGHLWCSDVLSRLKPILLTSEEHVPTEFRVIGPLSNLDEFSQVFNCPPESAMNPMKKCEIY